MNTQTGCATSLRRSLQLDGIAFGLCGVMLVFAAQPILALVGLPTPGIARAVGALLLVYAGALLWNARRASLSRGEACSLASSIRAGLPEALR